MTNKYRLSASRYEREAEDEKIEPQKIYFISAEGNNTEKEYFEGLSANRRIVGINVLVDVEVLKRSSRDGNSAPQHVVELLEEYLQLRDSIDNFSNDIPKEIIDEYGIDFIRTYLTNPDSLSSRERNHFTTRLKMIGYDINYRRYLSKYDGDADEFCIMIDRDQLSHSIDDMQTCIQHCNEKGYRCFIANPCFEFWLLLHLSDVKNEYEDKMDLILENAKVSKHHTYVSNEVSKKAHHGKSGIPFKSVYLPHIWDAVERAKHFSSEETDLVQSIGCNLWKLLDEMHNY